MKYVYFSKTGNIKSFVSKANLDAINGCEIDCINEEFILITYTINCGEVPKDVKIFLKKPGVIKNMVGVIGSGNKNWGTLYNNAAILISKKFKVPMLMDFELRGNSHDHEKMIKLDAKLSA